MRDDSHPGRPRARRARRPTHSRKSTADSFFFDRKRVDVIRARVTNEHGRVGRVEAEPKTGCSRIAESG